MHGIEFVFCDFQSCATFGCVLATVFLFLISMAEGIGVLVCAHSSNHLTNMNAKDVYEHANHSVIPFTNTS